MSMKGIEKGGYKQKQRGAVLAVSLIILLVVTILSVQGIQTTLMQDKMTAAVRDGHIALETAEAGLVDAENFLETLVSTTNFSADGTTSPGLYSVDNNPLDEPYEIFGTAVWDATVTAAGTEINGVTPRYFIVELGTVSDNSGDVSLETGYGYTAGGGNITGFRVYSRAFGKNTSTKRIVSSYYGKRL